METTHVIGEGAYRYCYATNDSNLCVKKLKPVIVKKYLGVRFRMDMGWYLRMKFGIWDLNRMELRQIKRMPRSLKQYIPSSIRLSDGGLVMERPRDYDGNYSKSMLEFGKVRNDHFWNCIDRICDAFEKSDLWFNDVFFKGNNVLVKKLSIDQFEPVMIDMKEIGKNLSPLQVNLVLRSEQRKKFYRRLKRFKETYYAN